jgi:hypothetical protein
MGKVCDYPIDYGTLFNCCADEIFNDKRKVVPKMRITCQDCGKVMVLRDVNGKMMWTEE